MKNENYFKESLNLAKYIIYYYLENKVVPTNLNIQLTLYLVKLLANKKIDVTFEVWVHGPVNPRVYAYIKKHYENNICDKLLHSYEEKGLLIELKPLINSIITILIHFDSSIIRKFCISKDLPYAKTLEHLKIKNNHHTIKEARKHKNIFIFDKDFRECNYKINVLNNDNNIDCLHNSLMELSKELAIN